jgi:hypothetical protein
MVAKRPTDGGITARVLHPVSDVRDGNPQSPSTWAIHKPVRLEGYPLSPDKLTGVDKAPVSVSQRSGANHSEYIR